MTDPHVDRVGEVGTTSLGLLERARARDEAAWVKLTHLYGPVIERWCLRSGLQPADATDVRQEVLTGVVGAIGRFRHNRPDDTFRGWLYMITRNKIRDLVRKAKVAGAGGTDAQIRLASLPADEPDSEPPPDPVGERALYLRAIQLVRGEFESKTWEAFWKVTVDTASPTDVAAGLGMSVNAVYLARSRVLRRLREEFEGLIQSGAGTAHPAAGEGE